MVWRHLVHLTVEVYRQVRAHVYQSTQKGVGCRLIKRQCHSIGVVVRIFAAVANKCFGGCRALLFILMINMPFIVYEPGSSQGEQPLTAAGDRTRAGAIAAATRPLHPRC